MARMARRIGVPPVTARAQLSKSFPRVGIQPLPHGTPGRATPQSVGIKDSNPLTFFVIGDHGGIKAPGPQNAVSYAMQRPGTKAPAFVYSVGDVVYFNGDATEYQPQFYEPYGHLAVPIVAIPGNHDGDTTDDPTRSPLDTFMANFCAPKPATPAADPNSSSGGIPRPSPTATGRSFCRPSPSSASTPTCPRAGTWRPPRSRG